MLENAWWRNNTLCLVNRFFETNRSKEPILRNQSDFPTLSDCSHKPYILLAQQALPSMNAGKRRDWLRTATLRHKTEDQAWPSGLQQIKLTRTSSHILHRDCDICCRNVDLWKLAFGLFWVHQSDILFKFPPSFSSCLCLILGVHVMLSLSRDKSLETHSALIYYT